MMGIRLGAILGLRKCTTRVKLHCCCTLLVALPCFMSSRPLSQLREHVFNKGLIATTTFAMFWRHVMLERSDKFVPAGAGIRRRVKPWGSCLSGFMHPWKRLGTSLLCKAHMLCLLCLLSLKLKCGPCTSWLPTMTCKGALVRLPYLLTCAASMCSNLASPSNTH